MEQVLDVYGAKPDPDQPLVVMDEAVKQLLGDAVEPWPMTPGTPKREDYHYTRGGVLSLFLFFAPHVGWTSASSLRSEHCTQGRRQSRRVESSVRRTRVDWGHQIKTLVDEDFPKATRITLVCDNLDTHTNASLHETFPPEEAHRLARKLEIVHTPRNGSWLNVAEIELSILAQQCLNRRIKDAAMLDRELAAWMKQRNKQENGVKWQFTTADAHRIGGAGGCSGGSR